MAITTYLPHRTIYARDVQIGDIITGRSWERWYHVLEIEFSPKLGVKTVLIECNEVGAYGIRSSKFDHWNDIDFHYTVAGNVSIKPLPPPGIIVTFTQEHIDALLEAFEDQPEWEDVSRAIMEGLREHSLKHLPLAV